MCHQVAHVCLKESTLVVHLHTMKRHWTDRSQDIIVHWPLKSHFFSNSCPETFCVPSISAPHGYEYTHAPLSPYVATSKRNSFWPMPVKLLTSAIDTMLQLSWQQRNLLDGRQRFKFFLKIWIFSRNQYFLLPGPTDRHFPISLLFQI